MTEVLLRLPDDQTKTFIEKQVAAGQFDDASQFILNLIEQARLHAERAHVDQLLLEGLDSGAGIEVDRDWWLKRADEWAAKYAGGKAS
ncbi:MAG: hypothetical protein L0211_15445 [Planctomycetaceae bacterium]|nr:hypothetical protein [Planctomycetaceae bacterium]